MKNEKMIDSLHSFTDRLIIKRKRITEQQKVRKAIIRKSRCKKQRVIILQKKINTKEHH